jgi:hypothetical protein
MLFTNNLLKLEKEFEGVHFDWKIMNFIYGDKMSYINSKECVYDMKKNHWGKLLNKNWFNL